MLCRECWVTALGSAPLARNARNTRKSFMRMQKSMAIFSADSVPPHPRQSYEPDLALMLKKKKKKKKKKEEEEKKEDDDDED